MPPVTKEMVTTTTEEIAMETDAGATAMTQIAHHQVHTTGTTTTMVTEIMTMMGMETATTEM